MIFFSVDKVFVGQKHEDWSLPATITREAFEAIVRVIEKDRQQMCRNKLEEDCPASRSQSSVNTDSSSDRSSPIHGIHFIEQAADSDLPSQSSNDSFSEGEESRLSPVGARSQEDMDKDLTLLQMFYKLDENCLPPVYRLLPIR